MNCVAILSDDMHVVCCGEDNSLKATDIARGVARAQWQLAAPPRALAVGQDQVWCVCVCCIVAMLVYMC